MFDFFKQNYIFIYKLQQKIYNSHKKILLNNSACIHFEYLYPENVHKNKKISPQINFKILCNNPKIKHSVDIINKFDENYKLLKKNAQFHS